MAKMVTRHGEEISFGATLKKTLKKVERTESEGPITFDRGTAVFVRHGTDQQKFENVGAIVLKQGPRQVLVQFMRELPGLHNGEGEGADNRCWWIAPENLVSYASMAKKAERPKPQKKRNWRAGNLVRLKEDSGWDRYVGMDAVVLEHDAERGEVLIQFTQEMDGLHDGHGKGKPNRCLCVYDHYIVSYLETFTDATQGGVVSSSNVYSGSEEILHSSDVVEESPKSEWPEIGVGTDDLFERYTDNVKIKVALTQDVVDETVEEDFEEVEETVSETAAQYFDKQARVAASYRMAGTTSPYAESEVEQEPPPQEQFSLDVGQLSKVQNADGLRTPYDNQPATVLATGTFGRLLLQFDNRIRGGHNGKGVGEPGRCKWFYRKDVIGISIGEAVVMTERFKKSKKYGIPKPKKLPKRSIDAIRSGSRRTSDRPDRPGWVPSKISHQPTQSSENMWNDEGSAPKKRMVSSVPTKSTLPVTSRKLGRGARVVVVSPPSDNKALKGQQGIIILDSPNNHNVTIQFDKKIPGCHDANGEGHPGRCWNIHKLLIKPVDGDVVFYIKGDYKRGNKNLKDMEVKILAHITHPTDESLSIVEFTEEISKGHSADGIGKKAHCLSVPASIIGKKKKPKKKKVKTPHEVTAEKGAKKN